MTPPDLQDATVAKLGAAFGLVDAAEPVKKQDTVQYGYGPVVTPLPNDRLKVRRRRQNEQLLMVLLS